MTQSKIVTFYLPWRRYNNLVRKLNAMRRTQGVKGRPLKYVPLLSDGETRVRFVTVVA